MKDRVLQVGLLWLRFWIGLGIASHGYGKIFEPGRIEKLAEGVAEMGFPLPLLFAWAAALSEFVGGVLIMLGLGTRVAASFVLITMGVAFFVHHRLDPFKVKELAFLYGTVAATLIMTGAGRLSFDRFLGRKK